MPRRLIRNSKLTNRQLNELVKYFALEVPASRAANVMGINRHSAERVYQVIRRCLARECELHSPLGGEVECDESYFGGRRKGPRGDDADQELERGDEPVRDPVRGASPDGRTQPKLTYTESCLGSYQHPCAEELWRTVYVRAEPQ